MVIKKLKVRVIGWIYLLIGFFLFKNLYDKEKSIKRKMFNVKIILSMSIF